MICLIHKTLLFNNINQNQYGTNNRTYDLCAYMNNYNIPYIVDNFLDIRNTFNIFTSLVVYENYLEKNYKIPYHAIMLCATNIMEPYKKRYDILINKTKKLLILHNAYKAYLFRQRNMDAIFLPTFLYQYNMPLNNKINQYKYKYGISLDSSVCTVTFLNHIKNNFQSLLVMSRDNNIKNLFENTTSNKQEFFDSVENIILLTDKYSSSHVGSRFVFECIYLQKLIYILCPGRKLSYDRTLQQFSSLKYEYKDMIDIFSLWRVNNINPKLVMYGTYNIYLQNILIDIENKKKRQQIKQYQYAEDYI